jgi:hypothetical protein
MIINEEAQRIFNNKDNDEVLILFEILDFNHRFLRERNIK